MIIKIKKDKETSFVCKEYLQNVKNCNHQEITFKNHSLFSYLHYHYYQLKTRQREQG